MLLFSSPLDKRSAISVSRLLPFINLVNYTRTKSIFLNFACLYQWNARQISVLICDDHHYPFKEYDEYHLSALLPSSMVLELNTNRLKLGMRKTKIIVEKRWWVEHKACYRAYFLDEKDNILQFVTVCRISNGEQVIYEVMSLVIVSSLTLQSLQATSQNRNAPTTERKMGCVPKGCIKEVLCKWVWSLEASVPAESSIYTRLFLKWGQSPWAIGMKFRI